MRDAWLDASVACTNAVIAASRRFTTLPEALLARLVELERYERMAA